MPVIDLIPKEWQEFDFYKNKMSLWLQGNTEIVDRNEMYFDLLKNVGDISEEIFNRLNITDPDYENKRESSWATSTEDNWLDLIGYIYGLNRSVILSGPSQTLTNHAFRIYILSAILKSTFTGTRRDLRRIYTGSEVLNYKKLKVLLPEEIVNSYISYDPINLSDLNIVYHTSGDLTASIYMVRTDGAPDTQIENLLTSGLLAIESLGIRYTYNIASSFEDAYFETVSGSTISPQSWFDFNPNNGTTYVFVGNSQLNGGTSE